MNEVINIDGAQQQDRDFKMPEIGQWYWIKQKVSDSYKMEGNPHPDYKWFACAYMIGSNYVEFRSTNNGCATYDRIHFNDLEEKIIYEPNYKKIIEQNAKLYQNKIQSNIKEIQRITKSLGVIRGDFIDSPSDKPGLVPVTSNIDVKSYKNELIKAKEETIPNLQEQIKIDQEQLKRCISLEALGMTAIAKSFENVVGELEKRIFHVTLYAGLSEEIELVREGEAAKIDDKVHLMQRRLYMDEECLLNYKHGGMEFKHITEFDEWISEDENFYRCLPFPKCIVTFKVRRLKKSRYARDFMSMLFNFHLEKMDSTTFMYIRNGDKLYRMSTTMDFGEMIFPNLTDFDPQSPKMIKTWGDSLQDIMSTKDWEYHRDEEIKTKKAYEQWWIDNPYEKWLKDNNREDDGDDFFYRVANPYRNHSYDSYTSDKWQPLDKNNVFYDEGMKSINDKMEEYNRIALIVQGLLDRSDVLAPLPVVNLRNNMDFQERVKLLYDGDHVLYHGEKPSVKEYVDYCNSQITKDSVFFGQYDYWERAEAKKENKRAERRYWNGGDRERDVERYRPYGNPGPYSISSGKLQPRVRRVKFEWQRQIVSFANGRYGEMKNTSISVPIDELFNVSAYKIGDYKRFFQDPRTRQEYLKWAPMLLAAEEYHAGTWKEGRDFSGRSVVRF